MSSVISKSEWKNRFTAEEIIGRIGVGLISHPFDYAKILIQLGYEPFPPYISTTIFLRKRATLPGIFSYLRLIKDEDGFCGLYRGIHYKIAYTLLNGFITSNGNAYFEEPGKTESGTEVKKVKPDIYGLLTQLKRQTLVKVIAITATYPLQLLVIRSCAEFVGKENVYSSVISALSEIYSKEGLLGFYSGCVPRILGECFFIWTSQSIIFLFDNLIETDSSIKTYLDTMISLVVQSVFYPFHVVATLMCVNSSKSLIIAQTEPEFISWIDCWRHLSALGQLKRGSSLLWRYPYEPNRPSPITNNRPWKMY